MNEQSEREQALRELALRASTDGCGVPNILRDCIPVPKAEYHRLRRALKSLQALVAALDVCKPAVDAAFTFQHAHGMDYRGPTYGVQLDSAREFAKEMEAAEMDRDEKEPR